MSKLVLLWIDCEDCFWCLLEFECWCGDFLGMFFVCLCYLYLFIRGVVCCVVVLCEWEFCNWILCWICVMDYGSSGVGWYFCFCVDVSCKVDFGDIWLCDWVLGWELWVFDFCVFFIFEFEWWYSVKLK